MIRKTGWKFLVMDGEGIVSKYDKSPWIIGEWRTVDEPKKECVGLNCSEYISDALGFVRGTVLAEVEYGGTVIDAGNKLTCEKMRIAKAWKWTKTESIKMAIIAAGSVLENFERVFPDDKRPRLVTEAAENYSAVSAARSAYIAASAADSAAWAASEARSAYSAASAASAAYSAARSASAASEADSAASAAYSAASAARSASAASAADSAAYSAASAAEKKQQIQDEFIKTVLPKMKVI